MKILFTGGGTMGHIFPIIAIARELQRLDAGNKLKLHYIGPKDELALVMLRQENIITHTIAGGKLRRYFSLANIVDILFKLPFSFVQSFFLLLFMQPKLVFSKGGTGSVPVAFWAHVFGKPIFVHESDTVPGQSNQLAGKWAKKVFTSFEKTADFDPRKTICVGNPIRTEILEGNEEGARENLQITFEKPVVLFWGGSLGAQPLNELVLLALPELLARYEVIHVAGKLNYDSVKTEAASTLPEELKPYYHLHDSLNEVQLKHALYATDVVVSRAGGSIFEIAAAGKPSILVPLPGSAGDHQSKNAYEYAESGAAVIIEQSNLTPNFIMGKIDALLTDPEPMRQAALAFAKPLAAKTIAREILEYVRK